jgi:sugar phosphate permease
VLQRTRSVTICTSARAQLVAAYGWRVSFFGTGALGLVFAAIWFVVYRDPVRSRANQAELVYIREGHSVAEDLALRPPAIGELFCLRTTWGLMIGFFCSNILNYFFITWYPSYLVEARHFSLAKVATVGSIPPLVAIAGGLLGGFTADRLFRAGWSLTRARKTCLVGGMLMSAVIVIAAIVPNIVASIALFSLSYGAVAFAAANINGLAPEIAPTRRHVALLQGIQTFGGNLAGIVTSTFTGVMLALTSGSYVIPLAVTAGFAIAGAAVYAFVVGPIAPLELSNE